MLGYGHLMGMPQVKISVGTHSTNYFGRIISLTTECVDYSSEYLTNPYMGSSWTWGQIEDV